MNRQKRFLYFAGAPFLLMYVTSQSAGAFEKPYPFFQIEPTMNEQVESFLIDDFSDSDGLSTFGTQWRMFTDRVMEGKSTAEWGYEMIEGRRAVRLQGDISLENNGGFAQIALPLTKERQAFDASDFKGVRIWVLGNNEAYYIHIRTEDTRQPWQYYSAKFVTDGSWQKVEIPFSNFNPESLGQELNTTKLVRIAVVAIKKEFVADVAVSRLEFYR